MGPNVAAFEAEVAAFLGVSHALSCASGTDALHLALRALNIGAGDEVITTPFTFFGTVEAICYVGARPVFVDIDPLTLNLDTTQIEAAITPATKAILPVHLFGLPVDMEPLLAIADQYDLQVIEDCAQSFGATIAGRATGSFGNAGCFSFFPSKNLGAYGDGGMVVTNSDEVAATIRELRNHGSKERYFHHRVGYNSRLDELQAVILRAKLKRITHYNNARRRVAARYSEGFADISDIVTPVESVDRIHVYHQYTVLVPERDRLFRELQAQAISCAVYYPRPLHRQPVFAEDYAEISLPVTEAIAEQCLSLPMYPELSDTQVDQVIAAVRNVF